MVVRYKKLIFVDTNDNCRAPMAKFILKRKFLTNPLTIESRGLVVLFPEPMMPKAEMVMEKNSAFIVDGFSFEDEDLYKEAKKEAEGVRYMKARGNLQ